MSTMGSNVEPLPKKAHATRKRKAKVQDVCEETGEVLSMETRARRKRELLQLRGENQWLREERYGFLEKIVSLEHQLEDSTRDVEDPTVVSENAFLLSEIEEHKRLMFGFLRLQQETPKTIDTMHLYKEGAQSAVSYVLGLVSQSQAWQRTRLPPDLSGTLENLSMHFQFKNDMFGTAESNGARRLNTRIDFSVPDISADQGASYFWNMFSNAAEQQKLYKAQDVEIREVDSDKMPDQHTKVLHYERRGSSTGESKPAVTSRKSSASSSVVNKSHDAVFVLNRVRRELAKSTLTVPKKARKGGAQNEPVEFGNITATVVSMTTTTLHTPSIKSDCPRVSSMIVKGAVVWNEDGNLRVCMVYSQPEEFNGFLMHNLSFNEFVNAKGTATKKFVTSFRSTVRELGNSLPQKAAQRTPVAIPSNSAT